MHTHIDGFVVVLENCSFRRPRKPLGNRIVSKTHDIVLNEAVKSKSSQSACSENPHISLRNFLYLKSVIMASLFKKVEKICQ